MDKSKLLVYSLTHAIVDFSCALVIFTQISGLRNFATCVLIYNFFAFAMQMPLGLLADKLNQNPFFASLGCILVALAYPLSFATGLSYVTAVVCGIGNALFHLGGGIDTLNKSTVKAKALGIFVCPGALGLYLGTLLGKSLTFKSLYLFLIPLVLIAFAYIILAVCKDESNVNSPLSLKCAYPPILLLPLFLVVVLRSYAGMNQHFSWKSQWIWAWILLFATILGKCFGGIIMDRIGFYRAAFGSLGLAVIMYILSLFVLGQYPLCGVLSVFLLNLTMPLTLWAVAKIMPGAKGFGFGMLTLALFLGYLPSALL